LIPDISKKAQAAKGYDKIKKFKLPNYEKLEVLLA